jgi:Zn-dependent M28 family amino/carboxypeptidase
MFRMPGKSASGDLPPLDEEEWVVAQVLRSDIEMLAGTIGERNLQLPSRLQAAADYITTSVEAKGYRVRRVPYEAEGVESAVIEAVVAGTTKAQEIIVIGAHYDTVPGCPGANDNGTGIASVLALARMFAEETTPARTIRFVFFPNEEPPYFMSESMGSHVYAKECHSRGEKITAMLSLETMGYYTDEPNTQDYPLPALKLVYPSTGNYIAFVGDVSSGALVRRVVGLFREEAQFPSEGTAIPGFVPGAYWSDHWSFRQFGYPAIMVTDTAPFRYRYYHTPEDTPEKVDYERLARVVVGLRGVLRRLAAG